MSELKNEKLRIPYCIMMISALLIVASYFLPIASAKGEYREYMKKYASEPDSSRTSLTRGELMDMTYSEYIRASKEMGDRSASFMEKVSWALLGFSVLTLLFVLWKKPVGSLIMGILSMAPSGLFLADFISRGSFANDKVAVGLSYYVFGAGILLLFISCIWFSGARKKLKYSVD